MSRTRIHHRRAAATALLTAALLAAIAEPAFAEGDDSDMAGDDSSAPTVLAAAWYGGEGRPQADVVTRFAEEVDRISGGTLEIEVSYGTTESWERYSEGEFELLLTPTRSLDTMGVDTFVPLTLPFVVHDDEQADRVATLPVVDSMMEGLAAIDSTGLLLAPVYPMHLGVAGDKPLRSLDQLATGLRIAPPGDAIDRAYEALGAAPTHGLDGGDWDAARADGSAAAFEWPIALVFEQSTMATNFTMFYEFVALIAHDDALAELSDEQRSVLIEAAVAAQQRSIDEREREADTFRNACTQGASLRAMPMTLIADIGSAVDDAILSILENPDLKRIYDRVVQVAGQRALAWPDECVDGEVVGYEPPPPPSMTFPEGVYRAPGRTSEQLLVSGVGIDQASNNESEYWEVTFSGGDVSFTQVLADGSEAQSCNAAYTVDGDGLLTMESACGTEGTYSWHETAEGIALEMMPTDTPLYLIQDWDNTALVGANLVRVD